MPAFLLRLGFGGRAAARQGMGMSFISENYKKTGRRSAACKLIGFSVAILAFVTACASATPLRTAPNPSWLQQLEQQAINEGVSPSVVHEALDDFRPNPRVIELDQKQPETTITFDTYKQRIVTADRIRKGAELARLYAAPLAEIEARTGVPPHVVVALWGIESSYGENPGNFEVINSLATLAYEGRRSSLFRKELISALKILERENMTSDQLRGSWAGAMGQCQFMPSTYLRYAYDSRGDGKSDIWNDPMDVLGSIANYLAAEGWKPGLPWGIEVKGQVPLSEVGMEQKRPVHQWASMNLVSKVGMALPQSEQQASLVQPGGQEGPSFLVYDNTRALMRWNRSTYFAVSVGLLADGIRGGAQMGR